MQKFKTKSGLLTKYAFICGYQEKKEFKNSGILIRLYLEPNGYHVRSFDHKEKNRLFWEVYPTLKQARKVFNMLARGAKFIENYSQATPAGL